MSDRKKDHIELAFKSQLEGLSVDNRFNYEPLINAHQIDKDISTHFLGKTLKVPIWVSSMTGGTQLAEIINKNLATACAEFGMGMGLGSCRMLLDDDTFFHQFDVRGILGDELPLYANLGIAQIEKLVEKKEFDKIDHLIDKLKADGLFVHINPLQEYFQPEGDLFKRSPLDIIHELSQKVNAKIIVKEVGQGMGPESLDALMQMSVAGIEFGAFGGTNFAKVELMRSDPTKQEMFGPFSQIGHTANEMVEIMNRLKLKYPKKETQLIVSGGVRSFLDGFYLIQSSNFPAVYGQASAFLRYAKEDYSLLQEFVSYQIKGLRLAYNFLKVKQNN